MKIRLALMLLCTAMSGCYSSKPIGPLETAVFDERLVGRWTLPPSDDETDRLVVAIARFNEKEYIVSPVHDFNEKDAIRFYVTELDGQRFMNAQNLDPDLAARDYMFARYTMLSADEVLLEVPELDAIPHEVASSAELVERFRSGANDPGFYGPKPSTMRRVVAE